MKNLMDAVIRKSVTTYIITSVMVVKLFVKTYGANKFSCTERI